MCKVLAVSRSSYYRRFSGGPSARALGRGLLTRLVKEEFDASRQTYGSPRIAAALGRKGHAVSRRRVARIMRANGWSCRPKRRFRATTDSRHLHPVSPDRLGQQFGAGRPGEAWVSDITYVRTGEGWLCLTTVIDLFDRQVVGRSLSTGMQTGQTVVPAWKMARMRRQIKESPIFHSDRGVQYASGEFRRLLAASPLVEQSMGRKGNCRDNAVAESFFKTLRTELVHRQSFPAREKARPAIFQYIETWHNRKRLHPSLGYRTPAEAETEYRRSKKVA